MNIKLTPLLQNRNARKLFRMVTKRRSSNKGMIGASLLGVGLAGATFWGMIKKKNSDVPDMKRMLNQLEIGNSGQMPSLAAITEFSKEIMPDKKN